MKEEDGFAGAVLGDSEAHSSKSGGPLHLGSEKGGGWVERVSHGLPESRGVEQRLMSPHLRGLFRKPS